MSDTANRKQKWTLGLLLLSLVVVLWVLSSFLVNDLFEKDIYAKPFLMTYLNTTTFVFYLVPYLVKKYRTNLEYSQLLQPQSLNADKLTLRETVQLSLQFCVLWFLSNLATNLSLVFTSVSSQTILSSTLSFFTLVIGVLCHVESINNSKIFGLVLSMCGIVLVNKFDFQGTTSPELGAAHGQVLVGNLMLLAGAAGYGIYSILLKIKVKNDANMDFQIFFGFVGLFNMVSLWLPLVVLHILGVERLEWPKGLYTYTILVVNGLITFVSDFFWAKAMILTSPLTVTVGLSLTIPLLMFGDLVFKHQSITLIYFLGAVVIGVSFIIINNDEEIEFVDETEPLPVSF